MDKSIPAGAARLLDFIGDIEAPRGYGTIYGNKQHKLKTPLVQMTLADVMAAQPKWSKAHGSSATGRYQFMAATLRDLKKELNLSPSQKFDADLQDRLGFHLLKRRGYEAYMAGQITVAEFGKRLAQEWASLPVLKATKGGSRNVKRGQSFYAGDGLNKSLTQPETVEAVLAEIRNTTTIIEKPVIVERPVVVEKPIVKDPENLDKPLTGSKTIWTYLTVIFTGIGGILESLGFVNLDWRVQIFMLALVIGLAAYGIKRRRDIAKAYREIKTDLGVAAVLLALGVGTVLFTSSTGFVYAHDALPTAAQPEGWKYPFSCCSGYDCRAVPERVGSPVHVNEVQEGYRISSTGEVVAFSDARLKNSPDGLFHWCSVAGENDSRTICLFVPPRSF